MTNPNSPLKCPDCGASVASSDAVCWLCSREAGPVPVSLRAGPHPFSWTRVVGGTVLMVVLSLMMFPAAGIAFFVVCVSTSEGSPYPSPTTNDMIVSGVAGILVLAAFVLALVFTAKRI